MIGLAQVPEGITKEVAREMMTKMVTLQVMDKTLYTSQRQGRISFYMTSDGEEGTMIGSAAGLDDKDTV